MRQKDELSDEDVGARVARIEEIATVVREQCARFFIMDPPADFVYGIARAVADAPSSDSSSLGGQE